MARNVVKSNNASVSKISRTIKKEGAISFEWVRMAIGKTEQPPDVSPSWSLARNLLCKPKVFQPENQSAPLETGSLRSARADLV